VGRLLPGGRYQADDGFVYPSYQAAANRGQDLQAIQNAGSSILRGLSNPLGLINQYEAARKGGFGFGRSASAMEAPNSRTQLVTSGDADLGSDPGRMFPKGSRTTEDTNLISGDRGRSTITSPNTTYQAADEEYRNLLAQYGGAPGISQLAGMTSLPTGFTPTGASKQASLKDYYAAQALQGNANLGTITSGLTQGMQGAEASNMAAWAKANPGLAQQLYAKQASAGQGAAPGGRDISSFIGDVNQYAGQGQASSDEAAFGTPANTTPAPWHTQGQAVSAPYAEANQKAAEKTTGSGAPALNTTAGQPSTGDNVVKFLNGITPFMQTLVGPGGLGNYGIGR
jgi:hypothetical protein